MTALRLRTDFNAQSFAPFGAVITRPDRPGDRRFFSDWLGGEAAGLAPVFHTNLNNPASLPLRLTRLEKHPHAAQAFVPLDVSRYVVVVAPTARDGAPAVAETQAFVVPGHLGVIYRAQVWHAGASVLDRAGSFAVLMWRGAVDDDVFADVNSIEIGEEAAAAAEVG